MLFTDKIKQQYIKGNKQGAMRSSSRHHDSRSGCSGGSPVESPLDSDVASVVSTLVVVVPPSLLVPSRASVVLVAGSGPLVVDGDVVVGSGPEVAEPSGGGTHMSLNSSANSPHRSPDSQSASGNAQ